MEILRFLQKANSQTQMRAMKMTKQKISEYQLKFYEYVQRLKTEFKEQS